MVKKGLTIQPFRRISPFLCMSFEPIILQIFRTKIAYNYFFRSIFLKTYYNAFWLTLFHLNFITLQMLLTRYIERFRDLHHMKYNCVIETNHWLINIAIIGSLSLINCNDNYGHYVRILSISVPARHGASHLPTFVTVLWPNEPQSSGDYANGEWMST